MKKLSLALLFALLLCCAPDPPDPTAAAAPPLILISIDTLRSDRLGCYGYQNAKTPNIDQLASEAILFERAYTVCPLTLPAHSSLMTGELPTSHGVRDNRGFVLDETLPTLAEQLSDAGYRTGGFVSSMVLRSSTGISRGFEHWDDEMNLDVRKTFAQRRGDATLERALSWLSSDEDNRPPFLFLHLYDPHSPYDAPSPWAEQIEDVYDAEIGWTDDLIGKLMQELRRLGLDQSAWVVLLSDHGEGLGDHVEQEHGLFLYREAIQIPMILRPPGGTKGLRRSEPVSIAELMPTLLDRLGLPTATERAWLSGQFESSGIYSETLFPKLQYGFSPLRSAIRGELQYIQAPRPELYDLQQDPASRDNLLNRRSAPPSLLSLLEREGEGREVTAGVDAEDAAALAALGYVGGAELVPGAKLEDPKDRVAEVEELFALSKRVGKSADDDVERRLVALMSTLNFRNESLAITIANNLLQGGDLAGASQVMHPFRAQPTSATRQTLGQIALEQGRLPEAEAQFRQVIVEQPQAVMAHLGLGMVALSAGQTENAARRFDETLRIDDQIAEAWNGRAIVSAQRGEWDRAIEAWRKAVDLDPELTDAWYNLALALDQRGQKQAAAEIRRQLEQVK